MIDCHSKHTKIVIEKGNIQQKMHHIYLLRNIHWLQLIPPLTNGLSVSLFVMFLGESLLVLPSLLNSINKLHSSTWFGKIPHLLIIFALNHNL